MAFWLIFGLAVATMSAIGALTLGGSLLAALIVYIAAGLLTLILGLVAAILDEVADASRQNEAIFPAE